jgi:hypothetical protein
MGGLCEVREVHDPHRQEERLPGAESRNVARQRERPEELGEAGFLSLHRQKRTTA